MQLVVVDMGTDATADQLAWVVDACSGALSHGRCVPEVAAVASVPEAVAIVRVKDVTGRSVRIEVGRRREERAAWSVRELDFGSGDPPAECWRTVGLALATLVGEIEAAERAAGDPAAAEAEPDLPSVTAPDVLVVRPRAFIGLGILLAQSGTNQPLRWGGDARLAWIFGSGVQLSLAGDYSAMSATPGLNLDWFRLTARAGYRHFVSPSWSLGLAAGLGVRGLGVEASDAEGTRAHREWSALALGGADATWQLTNWGGLWFELALSSIGRRTRLIARDGSVESELPAGELTASLGLWLAP